jgi:hypothetical protein
MKKFTLIVLLTLSIQALKAQDSLTIKPKHHWLQVALLASSVVFNGIGDGLNARENYATGHAFNFLSIGSLIAVPLFDPPDRHKKLKFVATYLLIRYAFFDQVFNKAAQLPMNYLDGQNVYDKALHSVPPSVLYSTKIISLGFVIFLNKK